MKLSQNRLVKARRLKSILSYEPLTGLFRWEKCLSPVTRIGDAAGCKNTKHKNGYVAIQIDRMMYKAHRLAWFYMTGKWPKNQIDHINRDRSDNRWSNLREATNGQNKRNGNVYASNRSGIPGVFFSKPTNSWHASISVDKKRINIGYFKKIEDAAIARSNAEIKYFGKFRPGISVGVS